MEVEKYKYSVGVILINIICSNIAKLKLLIEKLYIFLIEPMGTNFWLFEFSAAEANKIRKSLSVS